MTLETDKATKAAYKQISSRVNVWLELHQGERFDLTKICNLMGIVNPDERNLVSIKLNYEATKPHPLLEKSKGFYRYIDTTIKNIDWVNAQEEDTLNIKWPYDREEETFFSFDKHVVISPKDIIVIAGVSNMGKTAFCLNFLWDNMDNYPCTLMGSEYSPVKFKRRIRRMKWANPLMEDGTPKFELIERYDDWKDIIRPNNINIIDWVTVNDGEFYKMGSLIQGIQSKLDKGISLISIQKSSDKGLGEGGSFSERLSSLYLLLDYERLTVRKAKEWDGTNPNNKMYRFKIVDGGTKFHDIHEIKKCGKCYASGKSRGQDCDVCQGTGYTDVEERI